MSSTFFNIHYPNISRQTKLELIEQMYNGDSLPLFKKRYVNELDEIAQLTDWNRLYESVNYLEFCMSSYTSYIRPVTRLKGFSKKLSKIETKQIKEFYKINNWRTLVGQIAKLRKLYGDVYVYWFLNSDKIPMLRIIPSKFVDVKIDMNQKPIAYIFEKDIYWDERQSDGTYLTKQKTVKMEFKRGFVETYENGKLINSEPNEMRFANEIPIIHFQFEKNENSQYSEIPSENLVDLCLSLDRIETDIADINHSAGSPMQVIIDGKVNSKHSRIGPNAIMYVDSFESGRHQAMVKQLEITNSLESLYRERDEKLFMLFTKGNLLPPEIVKILSKSDSSKVIASIKEALINELKDFYEEFNEKTKILFKALMPTRQNEDIGLEIPSEPLPMSILDKAILIKSGVNTIQEHLRTEGKTEEEIEQHLEEVKEQNEAFTATAKNEIDSYDVNSSTETDTNDQNDITKNDANLNMDNKLK